MQHVNQVAGAVNEAVVPGDPLDRDGRRLAVAEHHQLREIYGPGGAPVHNNDATVADDFDAIVVGAVSA